MEKTVNVKHFIVTIENVLEDKICDEIVEQVKKYNEKMKESVVIDNEPFRQDKQTGGENVLSSFDVLRDLSTDNTEDIETMFYKVIKESLLLYTKIFPTNCLHFLDNGQIYYKSFKFQETPISGGFHNWHSENNIGSFDTKTRFLAWSIFLNDVLEGGELEFLNYSMRIKPKKGSMVLFPAYFTHAHRGNPPISNTKYIATGWYKHLLDEL